MVDKYVSISTDETGILEYSEYSTQRDWPNCIVAC